ncbi:AMP-binding protein [bacterium]|nr:AMP-binding protein [candidate division CSSED10-310 bacterium]
MKIPYMDRFPDVPIPLGDQLKRCVDTFGDRRAVSDVHITLTWRQLKSVVDIFAGRLVDLGVKPGDRILVAMERKFDIVPVYLAIACTGAISVPFNFKASADEQVQILELIQPVCGFFHRAILEQNPILHDDFRTLIPDDPEFRVAIQRLQELPEEQIKDLQWPDVKPDDPAYLNMTSGSTGAPKAALATHRVLYGNTRACVEALALDETDVHLPLFAVMSHPHEIFCRALFTGAAIVLLDNLYPRSIAETIQNFHVTCMMTVSPVYKLLMPFLVNKKFDVSSLRLPESGGMTTASSLLSGFQEITGIPIVPVWGSTESMGIAFCSELTGTTPANSVGKCLPGYSARIVDRNNREVADGEVGEMCLRGTGIMAGYWNGREIDSSMLKDGWYHTGDLFERDRKGNFCFRGRLDAMMKVGGIKIYPAEIEAALFSHPFVREAVVIPFDDPDRGIVPLAIIVTEPGESLTDKQLRRFLKFKLGSNKMPKIFRFLPEMPRTSSGKIDRKALSRFGNMAQEPTDESLKRRLEAIDLKILHLLNERLRIENAIRPEIRTSGFHPERIQETIEKLLAFNPGPLHDSLVEELFRKILSLRTLY